jgi:uncharacterized RDD family membrane protein YckC
MDTLLRWQVGFCVHGITTGRVGLGSPLHAPILSGVNHTFMFNNRIGFGPRFWAALIDFILPALISLPLIFLGVTAGLSATLGIEGMMEGLDFGDSALLGGMIGLIASLLVMAVISMLYSLIEAATGASPGKRMMGLKIAHADGTAGDVQFYLLRWGIKNSGNLLSFVLPGLSSVVSLVFFLGCFAALDEKKLALHDMIIKSAVFKKGDIVG